MAIFLKNKVIIEYQRQLITELESKLEAKSQTPLLPGFDQVIELIPAPIFYKDPDGKYLGGNTPFANFVDVPIENIIGKTVFDLWKKGPAQIYHEKDVKLIENPGFQIYEGPIIAPDGNKHYVIFHKSTFHNKDGSVAGIIGTFWDVSKQKADHERILLENDRLTDTTQFKKLFITTIHNAMREHLSIISALVDPSIRNTFSIDGLAQEISNSLVNLYSLLDIIAQFTNLFDFTKNDISEKNTDSIEINVNTVMDFLQRITENIIISEEFLDIKINIPDPLSDIKLRYHDNLSNLFYDLLKNITRALNNKEKNEMIISVDIDEDSKSLVFTINTPILIGLESNNYQTISEPWSTKTFYHFNSEANKLIIFPLLIMKRHLEDLGGSLEIKKIKDNRLVFTLTINGGNIIHEQN